MTAMSVMMVLLSNPTISQYHHDDDAFLQSSASYLVPFRCDLILIVRQFPLEDSIFYISAAHFVRWQSVIVTLSLLIWRAHVLSFPVSLVIENRYTCDDLSPSCEVGLQSWHCRCDYQMSLDVPGIYVWSLVWQKERATGIPWNPHRPIGKCWFFSYDRALEMVGGVLWIDLMPPRAARLAPLVVGCATQGAMGVGWSRKKRQRTFASIVQRLSKTNRMPDSSIYFDFCASKIKNQLCILWIGLSTEMALELWCIGCIHSFWWLGAARLQLCWGCCAIAVLAIESAIPGPTGRQGSIGDGTWQFLGSNILDMSVHNWKPELKYSQIHSQASSCHFCLNERDLFHESTWLAPSQPDFHLLIQQLLAVRPICSPLTFCFPWIAIFLVVCLTWLYSLCDLRYRFPAIRFPTQRCYLGP